MEFAAPPGEPRSQKSGGVSRVANVYGIYWIVLRGKGRFPPGNFVEPNQLRATSILWVLISLVGSWRQQQHFPIRRRIGVLFVTEM